MGLCNFDFLAFFQAVLFLQWDFVEGGGKTELAGILLLGHFPKKNQEQEELVHLKNKKKKRKKSRKEEQGKVEQGSHSCSEQ